MRSCLSVREIGRNPFSSNKIITCLFLILIILNSTRLIAKCHRQQLTNNNNKNAPVGQTRSLVLANGNAESESANSGEQPDFAEAIGNQTIALGRDAQLSCKINNLGHFRTAWLRVEDKGILSIHNNIITRNYRIGLVNNDDSKNFILTIKNVQLSDKGGYMCQINSVPMKYAIGYLDVLTPPAFDELQQPTMLSQQNGGASERFATVSPLANQLASTITVSEGSNATLSCQASGHPPPQITWRREDNQPIMLNGSDNLAALEALQKSLEGSTLNLSAVTRLNSGAYLCIASNGVQPSASKRQVLDVQFSPVIRVPQTEIGGQLGQLEPVQLVCYVELNPLGSYHWVKVNSQRQQPADDDQSLIEHDELINSDKFEIVIKQQQAASERIQMVLNVRQLEKHDFALYKCIAKNSLGIQSGAIRLHESSSFSLDKMFRGDSGNRLPDRQHQESEISDEEEQQRDQAPTMQPNRAGRPAVSRAHTRSSWIQRAGSQASGGHKQQQQVHSGNAQPSSGSAFTSRQLSPSLPTLFLLLLLLLIGTQTSLQVVGRRTNPVVAVVSL